MITIVGAIVGAIVAGCIWMVLIHRWTSADRGANRRA